MDNAKITYLIGAGASKHALPLNEGIARALGVLCDHLNHFPDSSTSKLIERIAAHASIDTYAKKLWLTDDEEVDRVKSLLSALLLFCQFPNNLAPSTTFDVKGSGLKTLDSRYDSLFASVLEKKDGVAVLPATFNIISWNYDLQIEKALRFYVKDEIWLQTLHDKFNIISHYNVEKADLSRGIIIKLNGIGCFSSLLPRDLNNVTYERDFQHSFNSILGRDQIASSFIQFAWEENRTNALVREIAKSVISQSDVLVIVGYSLPVFNREVDSALIKSFKGRRIYVQAPDNHAEGIRSLLDSIDDRFNKNNLVHTHTNCDQFLIPNERWYRPPVTVRMKTMSY